MNANERTFQGELYRIINGILSQDESILFSKITQEENVGTHGMQRFADGKLYSANDNAKIVSFELKNTSWDATDDVLVFDAAKKAMANGYEYFVTGTPRQIAIFRTFEPGVPLNERKLKIYTLSNIKSDNDVLSPLYENEVKPKLSQFLAELSDLLHGVKEIYWDSIDSFFVNKLSNYILESSAEMLPLMYRRINENTRFKKKVISYLQSQDIFNVSLNLDREDVYRICQLANYLLYLKVMFYSYLERDVPSLHLKQLEIPEDSSLLNQALRARFNDVLKHDFELIFEPNIFDDFEFPPAYIPVLKHNVEQIRKLNFRQLTADVVGSIYNTLIDNQEQHDRGQHFTNTNEVDIVNAFCIKEDTKLVLDSGCGAGTFLVRAYALIKHFNPSLTHAELLERVWGIEISPFPAFLSVMNLSLLDIKTFDNYPIVIREDFADIDSSYKFRGLFLNANRSLKLKTLDKKHAEVEIPVFDACVGNPPYIRQEFISNKKKWQSLAKIEFGIDGINSQSDLYVYYLMHTAAFLKEGGRLGYVISTSWLDVSFGEEVQKFLLDHFKIVGIIENQKTRSFDTALVNTVILIIEKCSDADARNAHDVRFVRINDTYEKFLGTIDAHERFHRIAKFCDKIQTASKSSSSEYGSIELVNQRSLAESSMVDGKYTNGYWGAKYLRAPEIYKKLISVLDQNSDRLDKIIDVKYGIKTGANSFFYLKDNTEKAKEYSESDYRLVFGVEKSKSDHYWRTFGWYHSKLLNRHFVIERKFLRPIYKSQKEADRLEVNPDRLKLCVLFCSESIEALIGKNAKVVDYIRAAENKPYEIQNRPSVASRPRWYDLTASAHIGEFIFPSKIGERFRLIDNRESNVVCDKVNYVFKIRDGFEIATKELFLYLNSTIFRFLLDLFSRQMVVKVSDVDVNVVRRTPILHLDILTKHGKETTEIYNSLRSREQGTIYEEIKQKDRRALDLLIFNELGLNETDLDDLYYQATKYVRDREDRFESLGNSSPKKRLDYDSSIVLIRERFSEIQKFKNLIKGVPTKVFDIPSGKGSYPKSGIGSDNLFGLYSLSFKEDGKVKNLEFSSPEQFELFEFINRQLGLNSVKIKLPQNELDCKRILEKLKNDFDTLGDQIKGLLKTHRSSANYLSIYRDLVMEK